MTDRRFGTAVPVLKAVVETLSVKSALELGSGNWSTPYLAGACETLVSVETDPEWHEKNKQLYTRDGYVAVLHEGKGETADAQHAELIGAEHANDTAYRGIAAIYFPAGGDLLFVDQEASLRRPSLDVLHPWFRALVWHDADEPDLYRYRGFEPAGFRVRIIKRLLPWTALAVRDIDDATWAALIDRCLGECAAWAHDQNYLLQTAD